MRSRLCLSFLVKRMSNEEETGAQDELIDAYMLNCVLYPLSCYAGGRLLLLDVGR